MAFPTPALRAAWGSDPFASPSWTVTDGSSPDLTPRLISASVRHERQHSLAQFERAVFTAKLWNNDRRFDPLYTGGPYGSNVDARKKIQWRMTYGATTYDLFTGFVRSIKPGWDGQKSKRFVTIRAEDAFSLFAKRRLRLGQWASKIVKYNPRAFYRMDDDNGASVMKDYAPTPHDGSYTGRNKVTDVGVIKTEADTGSSLDCGVNDGAAVGGTGSGINNTVETPPAVGFACWVIIPSWPAAGFSYTLMDQVIDSTGAPDNWGVRILDNGKVRLNLTPSTAYDSDATVSVNEWHLITVLHTSGAVKIYVDDGDPKVWLVSPKTMNQDSLPHFGEDTSGSRFMRGSIDEVVLFVGSLPTDTDVKALYRDAALASDLYISDGADVVINTLLDSMGWPVGDRVYNAVGEHHIAKLRAVDTNYLQVMQDVIRTEWGLLFVRGDGKVYFDKEQPTSAPASTVTFGTGSGEIHYRTAPEVELTDDSQMLINEVQVTADGIPVVTSVLAPAPDVFAENTGSIAAYGPTGITHSGLFVDHDEMQQRAADILTRFAIPKPRVASVVLNAADDEANTVPKMLGTPLGATVTVKTPDGDSIVSQVVGISHDLDMSRPELQTTISLEPW